MDSSTLDSLLTAKHLLATARQQSVGGRHACTASTMSLHDALELVLLACLAKKNLQVKEHTKLDGLMNNFEDNICQIPHKTRLIGLTRSRGGNKHFGNTVDSHAAKEFLNKTTEAIDFVVNYVFQKSFHQIFSSELIKHTETKTLLEEASQILETLPLDPFECLVRIRMAIFIKFEEDYSVEEWKNIEKEKKNTLIESLTFKYKAPYYTRSKDWVAENVKDIFDFIQIDYKNLEIELMRYGICSADFFNLLRLTPKVFRSKGKTTWSIEGNFAFLDTSKETLIYCLSTAIDAIIMQETYHALHKYSPEAPEIEMCVNCDTYLYEKASASSRKIKEVKTGEIFHTDSFIPGFDDTSMFIKVCEIRTQPRVEFLQGYIPNDHVEHVRRIQ